MTGSTRYPLVVRERPGLIPRVEEGPKSVYPIDLGSRTAWKRFGVCNTLLFSYETAQRRSTYEVSG